MKSISVGPFSKVYYFHYDLLGSITNLTDSSGTTMWTDSYEPYGLIHSETKNSTQAPTAVIKFAGEYLDPTGLYHLRARQYDPSSGRFTTLDPLPNPVSDPYMSAYAYANDRPTVFTDPTGLRPDVCGSSIFRCWLKHDARHLGLVVIKVGGGCFVGGVTGEEALGGPLGLGLATVASPEVAVLLPAAGCIVGAFGAAVEEKTGYEGPSLTDPPVPLGQ